MCARVCAHVQNVCAHVTELMFVRLLSVLKTAGFPPHLENLEKQVQTWKSWKTWKNRGFWGKNLEKYCKTWKNI